MEKLMEEMNQKDEKLIQAMYQQKLAWGERPPVLTEETWVNDTMYAPKPSSSHVIAPPLSLRRGGLLRGKVVKPRGKLDAQDIINVLTALEGPVRLLDQENNATSTAELRQHLERFVKQYSLAPEHMGRPNEGVIMASELTKQAANEGARSAGETGEPTEAEKARLRFESESQLTGYGLAERRTNSGLQSVSREGGSKTGSETSTVTPQSETPDASSGASNPELLKHTVGVTVEVATDMLEEETKFMRYGRDGKIVDETPFVSNFHLVATVPDADKGVPNLSAVDQTSTEDAARDPHRILLNAVRHLRVPYVYRDLRVSGMMRGPHAVWSEENVPDHVLFPDGPTSSKATIERLGVSNLAATLLEAKKAEKEAERARAVAQQRALAAENARLLELRERQIKHSLIMRGMSPEQADEEAKRQAQEETSHGSVRAAMQGHVDMQAKIEQHLKASAQKPSAGQSSPQANQSPPRSATPLSPPPAPNSSSAPADVQSQGYKPSPAAQRAIERMKREAAMRKAGVVPEIESIWGGLPNIPGTKHQQLKDQSQPSLPRINNLWE